MSISPSRARAAIALTLVAASLAALPGAAHARGLAVEVTSGRADLVSDGQALVGVRLPAGVPASRLAVSLNGSDVSSAFRPRGERRAEGLVEGLELGANRVVASVPDGRTATLTITNHPSGGPLFGGPQTQPWRCQSGALDAQCNQAPTFTWLYKSTDPRETGLLDYDPANPPSDVATTTTDEGAEVPFIVRLETGYLDRDQYKVLVLHQPGAEWDRWAPPRTWNHKLLVPGGGGCGGSYSTSGAPLEDFAGTIPPIPGRSDSYVDALGRGFGVMSTALANTGHNCNVATEAEALIMVKERVAERYGDIRYTIGTGCSGGSIVQHTVANAYPGAVYDGLIVTCSYPDTFSAGAQFADYHLLRKYFEAPERWGDGVVWTPQQWAAVEGHLSHVNAIAADELLFKEAVNPISDCAGAASYRPDTNPGGVRCGILDFMVNVLGPRPEASWTAPEKAAGFGFAGVPFGNAGIQYGLKALRDGLITAEQFVDLNEKVGGLTLDMVPTAERLKGDDQAIANVYRSGLVNEGDHMENVAIIAHGGPDPGIAHDFAHAFWMRDRLMRAQGHIDNQVLWVGPAPLIGDLSWPTEALIAMDRWLRNVEADESRRPRARKIADLRPDDVRDRCQYSPGVHVSQVDGVCLPDEAHTRLSTPREVAGGNRLNDVMKCSLMPLSRSAYGLLGLDDAQFARLKAVFPEGVCDWSRPGVGQQPAVAWQTYQDADGAVVYGGRAMPRPPRSKTGGN